MRVICKPGAICYALSATIKASVFEQSAASLARCLDAEKLKYHASGGQRVAYSFRHFYICQQLLSGVDIYQLAANTGTNVQMVQKFYSKLEPDMFKKELRPEWG